MLVKIPHFAEINKNDDFFVETNRKKRIIGLLM